MFKRAKYVAANKELVFLPNVLQSSSELVPCPSTVCKSLTSSVDPKDVAELYVFHLHSLSKRFHRIL